MVLQELKAELRAILAEEKESAPDWKLVERLCLALSARMNEFSAPEWRKHGLGMPSRFLDDVDIRQKDKSYANYQRELLEAFLQAEGNDR